MAKQRGQKEKVKEYIKEDYTSGKLSEYKPKDTSNHVKFIVFENGKQSIREIPSHKVDAKIEHWTNSNIHFIRMPNQ